MLSSHCAPVHGWDPRVGEGGREEGSPGAHLLVHTHTLMHTNSLPFPFLPFIIFLSQALSLWVSLDLCSPFLSFLPSLFLMSTLPPELPSIALPLFPQHECTHILFSFILYFYRTFSMFWCVQTQILTMCYKCLQYSVQ